MAEYYELNGKSVFTIMSVGKFETAKELPSAKYDAALIRSALNYLDMVEYKPEVGNKTEITKDEACRRRFLVAPGTLYHKYNSMIIFGQAHFVDKFISEK